MVALRRSVEAGVGDVGVEEADGRLSAFLRDELGVHGGHYGELSGRKLSAARADRNALNAQLAEAEAERAEIAELSVEKAMEETKGRGIAGDVAIARQQLTLTQLRALESRLKEARQHQAAAAQRPQQPTRLSQTLVQAVRSTREAVQRLEGELKVAEVDAEATAATLRELKPRRDELLIAIDALSMYADTDPSDEDEVRGHLVRAQLGAEETAPARRVPNRDPQLDRFRHERAELAGLAVELPARWDSGRLAFAAIVGVIGLMTGAFIHPVGFAGILAALVLAVTARSRTPGPGAQLAARLASYGASSLGEIDERIATEDREIARAEGLVEERGHAPSRSGSANGKRPWRAYQEALDAVGAPRGLT